MRNEEARILLFFLFCKINAREITYVRHQNIKLNEDSILMNVFHHENVICLFMLKMNWIRLATGCSYANSY